MKCEVRSIEISKITADSKNPNEMNKRNFAILARNIKETGLYEPLTVRQIKGKNAAYQIINGYHRIKILQTLGYKTVNCVVWEVDECQAGVLLLTLNRLGGKDNLEKKMNLIKYLSKEIGHKELSKIIMQTVEQINKIVEFKIKEDGKKTKKHLLNAIVFMVTDKQKEEIEKAIMKIAGKAKGEKIDAAHRALALERLARYYNEGQKKG
ncbi:MAG: ParB-like nuclease domain-containing protein [Sedimentisphaerales bacterium]|nr:ParB-like nuclease domain-containing protein [Sedimentisphaerales bacterium]